MDALISAQAGTALLIEGANLTSIHANAPELAIPRRAEDVHLLFGEGSDLQVLEGVSRDQVARRLVREADSAEALQLFLILLDPELPGEIRREGAEELEALLAGGECREDLERVLYAHPLPSDADVSGALAHSAEHAYRVLELLRSLADFQPAILEARRSWIAIPDALFTGPAQRQRFQAALVREGFFRDFVLCHQAGTSFEPFLALALLNPVLRKIPGHRAVIREWIASWRRQETQETTAQRPGVVESFLHATIHTSPHVATASSPPEMPRTGASRLVRWRTVLIPSCAAALALLVAVVIRVAAGWVQPVQPFQPAAVKINPEEPELARTRQTLREGIGSVRAEFQAQRFTAARERLDHLQETALLYPVDLIDEMAQMRALDQEITTTQIALKAAAPVHQRDWDNRTHSGGEYDRRPSAAAVDAQTRSVEIAQVRETLRRGIAGVRTDVEAQNFTAARERLNHLQETAVPYRAELIEEVARLRTLDEEITATQISRSIENLRSQRGHENWQLRLAQIQGLLQEKSYPEAKSLATKLAGEAGVPDDIAGHARELRAQADQALKEIFERAAIETHDPNTQALVPQIPAPKDIKEWVIANRSRKGAVAGAVVGGVLAGLRARLLGQNVARGAAVGAVVGGVAGYLVGRRKDQVQASRDEAVRLLNYQPSDGYVIQIQDISFDPQTVLPGRSATLHIRYLVIGPDPKETIEIHSYRGIKYQGSYMTGDQVVLKIPKGGGVVESTAVFEFPTKAPDGIYAAEAWIEDALGRVNKTGTSPLYLRSE